MGREHQVKSVVIADGDTESAVIDLEYNSIHGLIMPTLTSATLTFKVAEHADGTFVLVKSRAGTDVSVSATTGGWAVSSEDLAALAGYRYLKIVSDVAQGAERTFYYWMKE